MLYKGLVGWLPSKTMVVKEKKIMGTINKFFAWWKETFRKQGIVGKVILGCSSLFVICCLCSVPIGILSPKPPTTATAEVASTPLVTQIEQPTEILLLTNIPEPTSESYISLLNCAGSGGIQNNGQYFNDFCLATGILVNDPEKLELAMREFCKNKETDFCDINAWADKENVPVSYPLTDSQIATQLAQYKKNNTTGYDCFILFQNGEQKYRSSGCSQ